MDMIAASLRNCSLSRRERRAAAPPRREQTDESEGATAVELNSEAPLPYHWQQYLDMRTGEVYYINWTDGTRTGQDPRASTAASYRHSSDADDERSYDAGSEKESGSSSEASSPVSSPAPTADSRSTASRRRRRQTQASTTLVAAGCKACFTYFMVPKGADSCPGCGGGGLLHLGRGRRRKNSS